MIERPKYLDKLISKKNNGLVKVIKQYNSLPIPGILICRFFQP